MVVIITVVRGHAEGRRFSVSGDEFLIGRSDVCHLRLRSRSVSRRHCLLRLKANSVTIVDLGSRNPTRVGETVLGRGEVCHLRDNDLVQIGEFLFRVTIQNAAVAADASPCDTGDGTLRDLLAELDSLVSESGRPENVDGGPASSSNKATDDTAINSDTSVSATPSVNANRAVDEQPTEIEISDEKPEVTEPGKLPAHLRPKAPVDSKDAARAALQRLLSGRR